MTSRKDLDDAFERDAAVGSEPRVDIFGRLGVHPDRLNPRSLFMESKVWAKSKLRNDTAKPFVIYGRPRSGTTLLMRLLDDVPDVKCNGELLHFFLFDPVGFLARLPKRAGADTKAFGVKLISYHLSEVQRIRRPLQFFDRIADLDYSVIHLTRDTWKQTMSLAKAQSTGVYFSNSDKDKRDLVLDPDRFLELLRWNARMLAYETAVMKHVPHHHVHYDDHLSHSGVQQNTINEICAFLGIPSAEVSVSMRRTGGKDGLQRVENEAELAAHVRQSELAHLVPADI